MINAIKALPKEKKDLLLGICVGAVAISAALYFLVADSQQKQQMIVQRKSQELFAKISQASALVKTAPEVTETLAARKEQLAKIEAGLAADRDTYSWMLQTINPFIFQRKNLNIPSLNLATQGPDTLVGRSPYRTATFKVKGVGYFHDFGKFFADFENAFPYFRIQNWDMSPAGGATGAEGEKLNVSFDIITPVRPGAEPAK